MKKLDDTFLVISPRDKVPVGFTVINTTSRDTGNLGIELSPFSLSNIPLYEGKVAKNLENAWQFSKVYKEFADLVGNPEPVYFQWAKKGWSDNFAHRYPNGKGNIPLYSYWKTYEGNKWIEHQWDYITARKNIYFPLYAKAVIKTNAFKELQKRVESGESIALWDFDGYNHKLKGMSYEDVVNCPKYKCGHAFVLYGLITRQLKIINNEFIFDFDKKIYHPLENNYPSIFKIQEFTFISNEQFVTFSLAKNLGNINLANRIYSLGGTSLMENFKSGKVDAQNILTNHLIEWKQLNEELSSLYTDKLSEIVPQIMYIGFKEKIKQNNALSVHLIEDTLSSSLIEKIKLKYK